VLLLIVVKKRKYQLHFPFFSVSLTDVKVTEENWGREVCQLLAQALFAKLSPFFHIRLCTSFLWDEYSIQNDAARRGV
jgi:hypothetical protein